MSAPKVTPHQAYVVLDENEMGFCVTIHPDGRLSIDEARSIAAFINDNYAKHERSLTGGRTDDTEEG